MPPEPGGVRSLYGACAKSINRRVALAGIASVLALPAAAAPKRVKAVAWTGEATVFEGARVFSLGIRTRVEPFVRARSTSWLKQAGEADARTLVIEPDDGWMEVAGVRSPLPPTLIAHEREQYGVYGYLLGLGAPKREGKVIEAAQPGFPPIRMTLDEKRIATADYTVVSPEGGGPMVERFTFEGRLEDHGVEWFKSMTIERNGRRYFQLWIDTFSVERG